MLYILNSLGESNNFQEMEHKWIFIENEVVDIVKWRICDLLLKRLIWECIWFRILKLFYYIS